MKTSPSSSHLGLLRMARCQRNRAPLKTILAASRAATSTFEAAKDTAEAAETA